MIVPRCGSACACTCDVAVACVVAVASAGTVFSAATVIRRSRTAADGELGELSPETGLRRFEVEDESCMLGGEETQVQFRESDRSSLAG